jgi:TatD DNase family protein
MSMSDSIADTHCHLTLDAFRSDLDQVLARANEAHVSPILIPGIDLVSSRQAVALAHSRPGLFAAIGVHPHSALSWRSDTREQLSELAGDSLVVAIGEIGLDFYRDIAPRTDQRHAFEAQLDLARDLELPVIVHQRAAEDDVLTMLLDWHASLPDNELKRHPGVLHGFSSSLAVAERAFEAGFFVGLGGPVTFKNARDLRQVVPSLPLERILTETDSPYLTPHPHRGKRNEPAMTRLVAQALSNLMESPLDVVAQVTSNNASSLFGWDDGTVNGHLL